MRTFAYFNVAWQTESGGAGVFLQTTDMQTLEWVLTKLREAGMNYRVKTAQKSGEFDGMKPAVKLDSLSGRDGTVALWIINQLCLHGWEPFASRVSADHSSITGRVALKRCLEKNDTPC